MSYSAKRFIICSGFHRSGTSFLAQALANSHCDMGRDLLGASFSNPMGHIEDRECVELNDSLLTYNQQNWQFYGQQKLHIPPAFVPALQAYVTGRITKSSGICAGVKDPRITLLLPQWNAAAPQAYWLFTYRHWSQCIHSLLRRSSRQLFHRSVHFSQHKVNNRFFEQPELAAEMWLHANRKIIEFVKLKAGQNKTLLVSQHALTCNNVNKEKIADFCLSQPGKLSFDNFNDALLTRNVDAHLYTTLSDKIMAQCEEVWEELQMLSEFPSAETLPQRHSGSKKTLSSGNTAGPTIPAFYYQGKNAQYLTALVLSEQVQSSPVYPVALRQLLIHGASPNLTLRPARSSTLLLDHIANRRAAWLSGKRSQSPALVQSAVTSVLRVRPFLLSEKKACGAGVIRKRNNKQPSVANFYLYRLVLFPFALSEESIHSLIQNMGASADVLVLEALYYQLLAINPSIENVIKFVSFLDAAGMYVLLEKYLSLFVKQYSHAGLRFRLVLLVLKTRGLQYAQALYQEFNLVDINSPLQAVYQRRIKPHISKTAESEHFYTLFKDERYDALIDRCTLLPESALKSQVETEYLRYISVCYLNKHGARSITHPYHQKTFQQIWKAGPDEGLYAELLATFSDSSIFDIPHLFYFQTSGGKLTLAPANHAFSYDLTVTWEGESGEKAEHSFTIFKKNLDVDKPNITLVAWYISCFVKSKNIGVLGGLYQHIVNDFDTQSFAFNS